MLYYAKALAMEHVDVFLVSCCSNPLNISDFEEVAPKIWVHSKKKNTKSLFGTISFVRNLYRFSREDSTDNSFLFYPSPLIYLELFSLIYLRKIKGQRVFNELNEIRKYSSAYQAPPSLKHPAYSLKRLVFKGMFHTMQLFLRMYTGLVCISSAIETYGEKYNRNTLRIPILTDPYKDNVQTSHVYAADTKFNIGFSGSIKPLKENLENFIQVLSELKDSGHDIRFNLCGPVEKSYKKYLFETLTKELGLDMQYHGNLNIADLNTFLSQQDLLVIPRGYTLQNHYGFSTKLSDYLNQKKIILVTDVSDNALFIKDGENGFIVPPDDNSAMRAKLEYIITNFQKIKAGVIEKAANTSLDHFYYKNYAKDLMEFLYTKEA